MQSFNEFLITEARLERLRQHLEQHHPFVIVSSDRGNLTNQENNDNFREFKRRLKLTKFGYNRVRGSYIEDSGREVYERSLIIYGNPEDEQRLKNFAIGIGNKFNQDSILFADSKGNIKLIATKKGSTIGNKIGDTDDVGNNITTSNLTSFFTRIGHKKFKFVKESVVNEDDDFADDVEYGNPVYTFNEHWVRSMFKEMLDKYGIDAVSKWESNLNQS